MYNNYDFTQNTQNLWSWFISVVTGNTTQETNNITLSESEGVGAGAVAGVTGALTLLVSLPVGVVLGYCCGRVCCVRPGLDCCLSVRCGRRRKRQREQTVVYEELGVALLSLTMRRTASTYSADRIVHCCVY